MQAPGRFESPFRKFRKLPNVLCRFDYEAVLHQQLPSKSKNDCHRGRYRKLQEYCCASTSQLPWFGPAVVSLHLHPESLICELLQDDPWMCRALCKCCQANPDRSFRAAHTWIKRPCER